MRLKVYVHARGSPFQSVPIRVATAPIKVRENLCLSELDALLIRVPLRETSLFASRFPYDFV